MLPWLSTAGLPQSNRQWARLSGPAAAAVAIGSILVATLVSPTFSWWAGALSDLGTTPGTVWLFNGGLVVGCVLGLPYGWALWTRAADQLGRLRAGTYVAAILSMAGVGLFPAGTAPHLPLALAFFVLCSLTLLVDGVARFRLRTGKLALLAGLVSPSVWPVWGLWVAPGAGIAVPEFVGAVLFALWIGGLSPERPGYLG
ncbi:MAG: DUF998 domain-containing protein [Halolamina sp.]